MLRFLFALMLIALPTTQAANAQTPDRSYTDMPVYILYCDEDPGRINAGGGKAPSPQQLIEDGTCTPAEGVALTFVLADDDWDFEEDELADEIEWDVEDDAWFNRCDADANGFCALNSPTGFDIVIGVVLHEGTVLPGYEPAFFQRGTHNFTEFAGYGLALIPADGTTPEGTTDDHQTLALNITQDGEPGIVLTNWEINEKDNDLYLSTTEGGWVSSIVAAGDVVQIELVNFDDDAEVNVVCGANDDATISVESRVDDDGELTITIPDTDSDIRCDVSFMD